MKLIEKVRETTKVLKTLSRRPRKQPPQRLQARVRASTTASVDDYEEEEPQTKLTSAFVVVLILHVVAVGGIYAFNQIKASRKSIAPLTAATAPKAAAKPAATDKNESTVSPTQTASSPTNTAAPSVPPTTKTQPYTVKAGDTLHAIARSHGTNAIDLKALNSLASDSIRPGQVLNVPASKPSAPVAAVAQEPVAPKKAEPPEPKVATKSYTVKGGDRLVFIAKRFSVSQEDLIALNKIKDPAKLQIGQTLKIPAKK